MVSYIIPTLWKSPNIFKLIKSFESIINSDAQLIIINNNVDGNDYQPQDRRITVLKMRENEFINPSWQLGVDYSLNNKVCIVNDDIIFDVKRFHEFVIEKDAKAICFTAWNRVDKDLDVWELVEIENGNARPAGGGQLMLVNKENWPTLPYEMKLWHGDDVIYYYNTLVKKIKFNYIKGMAITGDQSVTVTSDSIPKKMSGTFTQDTLEYYKKMHTLGLSCSTVFPMELKMAWKYGDIVKKLEFEKKLDRIINK
tara:strand:+ start:1241 stop:2002 length:762 start_codon:yes stop_codon:yes gene_type:complete